MQSALQMTPWMCWCTRKTKQMKFRTKQQCLQTKSDQLITEQPDRWLQPAPAWIALQQGYPKPMLSEREIQAGDLCRNEALTRRHRPSETQHNPGCPKLPRLTFKAALPSKACTAALSKQSQPILPNNKQTRLSYSFILNTQLPSNVEQIITSKCFKWETLNDTVSLQAILPCVQWQIKWKTMYRVVSAS